MFLKLAIELSSLGCSTITCPIKLHGALVRLIYEISSSRSVIRFLLSKTFLLSFFTPKFFDLLVNKFLVLFSQNAKKIQKEHGFFLKEGDGTPEGSISPPTLYSPNLEDLFSTKQLYIAKSFPLTIKITKFLLFQSNKKDQGCP